MDSRFLGHLLKIDASTSSLDRPNVAHFCVEIDVSKPLLKCFWIGRRDVGDLTKTLDKGNSSGLSQKEKETSLFLANPYSIDLINVSQDSPSVAMATLVPQGDNSTLTVVAERDNSKDEATIDGSIIKGLHGAGSPNFAAPNDVLADDVVFTATGQASS
ncbi:hypothetical protein ACH5RR_039231 [Cinchona calisaya]|uniref:Uncharacterized protein n=1 Tax=Cinchona calisaya TaxID=153742 RepID=A0ABD2XZ16_9GENT